MGAIGTVSPHALAPVEHRRKKKRFGYLAWLCLGSHYLYLGRPIRQLLFWLTLGGLLLWWLIDFFRLPEMIAKHNRRATQKLVAAYEKCLERRLLHVETLNLESSKPAPGFAPTEAPPWPEHPDHVAAFDEAQHRKDVRGAIPALVLTSALAVAAALYVFNPPPLFPHSGPSFRALRQVNVRALPSTAGAILAVVPREAVLSGTIEQASRGTGKWLKIGRGPRSGGYVAVQNLESL